MIKGKSVTELYNELLEQIKPIPEDTKKKELEDFNEIFGRDLDVESELRQGSRDDHERDRSYGRDRPLGE